MKNKQENSISNFFSALRNKLKLRTQFIIFLLLQTGLLLAISGFYVNWQVRKVVENELAEKLLAIGHVAAMQCNNTRALQLLPGEENSRTLLRLSQRLQPILTSGSVSRILLLDRQSLCYFDSRAQIRIGEEYYRARLDAQEIDFAFSGKPATSHFFFDAEGQPFKSVYLPVSIDDEPSGAVLCLEGSAGGLQAIDTTQKILLTIGLLSIVIAIFSAAIIARQVTRPLEKLEKAAVAIGRGQYDKPITQSGSSEVNFLARTIDKMRRGIGERHKRQQMMLAGVAHEIRNPLGGIKLFTGILQKTADASMQPHLAKILKEVNHLNGIISDFLRYARPVQARLQTVNVYKFAKEIIAVLESRFPSVQWDFRVDERLNIHIDPDHFRQILTNLIQNAGLALQQIDDPRISLSALQNDHETTICVADNGAGVAPDLQEKIFQPFFTTRNEGIGLGLALVQMLAEENGCRISLKSNQAGAEFCLVIPKIESGKE